MCSCYTCTQLVPSFNVTCNSNCNTPSNVSLSIMYPKNEVKNQTSFNMLSKYGYPPFSSLEFFNHNSNIIKCSAKKIPISRLDTKQYSCVPTARWIAQKSGEKRHKRGRIKVGRYLYHFVVTPPLRFWSPTLKHN